MPKRYREYSLSALFLVGSVLLAVVLFSQWVYFRGKENELKKLLSSKVEVHMDAPKTVEEHKDLPNLEEYSETVNRPLFMEGRRPVTEEASEPEPVPVEKKPLTVKLMGIVFSPNATIGLFTDAQGKYKRLRINDSIGGWKLLELGSDKAVMDQDGTREEVKLVIPKQKKGPKQPQFGVPPIGLPSAQPGIPPPPMGGPNPNNPVNPNFPEEPVNPDQPNDAVDETPIPPDETPVEQ